jgi:tRNA nucleotidyltransferase (CCA-adding enzyme)
MIINGIYRARTILRRFPVDDPVAVYEQFRSLNLETILFLMAISKDRRKQKVISHYLTELRNVKPILRGIDLKKMGIQPGPVYTKILKELLEDRLRGHLLSREDEEAFVTRYIQG